MTPPGNGPPPRAAALFDIDGTLINTWGAGRRAFEAALSHWAGRLMSFEGYDFSGRTDTEIFRHILARTGLPHPDPVTSRTVLSDYASRLEDELRASPRAQVCPGVERLLEELEADPDWLLLLVTGNLSASARIKLRHFGLDRYFEPPDGHSGDEETGSLMVKGDGARLMGAFGDDSEDRRDLVPIALDRLEAAYQVRLEPGRTVVVGDTERDVLCARAGGARVLAVATGLRTLAALHASNPDASLADLSDPPAVLDLMKRLAGLGA